MENRSQKNTGVKTKGSGKIKTDTSRFTETAPTSPERISDGEIKRAIDGLRSEMTELDILIRALVDRLEPVLEERNVSVMDAPQDTEFDYLLFGSPVALGINTIVGQLNRYNHILNVVHERLDL